MALALTVILFSTESLKNLRSYVLTFHYMTICVLAKPMRMLFEIIAAANRKTVKQCVFICIFQPFFDVILLIVLPSYLIPSSRSEFVLFRVIF